MADRKKTPDILNDLLGGAPAPKAEDTGIPASQLTSKPVSQDTGKPARHPARKPARQSTSTKAEQPSPEEPRLKATYYLSPEAMEALDEAWLKLRKMAKTRSQISKSLIVEQAILLAAEDLTAKGGQSQLAGKVACQ